MNKPSHACLIHTERLKLRAFIASDAHDIIRLAGDREVASTTRFIPHPYELPVAQQWLASLPLLHEQGTLLNFGITLAATGELIGSISLIINATDRHAELSYWIGKPYWNKGYATESGRAILRHAFENLRLHRVYAQHMARNPASGRVLKKLGMTQEGMFREHRYKWGVYEDLLVCGMTEKEWGVGSDGDS